MLAEKDPLELEAQADELDADADEIKAKASRLRAEAKRFRLERKTPAPIVRPAIPELLTKQELARTLKVSVATINRLEAEGLPSECVGHETARRYDFEQVRAFLQQRKPAPTTPQPKSKETADVADLLGRGGLRLASGRGSR